MIVIDEEAVPPGLTLQVGATAGYATAVADGDDGPSGSAGVPSLVARYTGEPRARRWVMVTRIDADDPPAAFEAMTAGEHWQPWASAHGGSRSCGEHDATQVAWSTSTVVVWVVSRGLDPSEIERFVAGIEVRR